MHFHRVNITEVNDWLARGWSVAGDGRVFGATARWVWMRRHET